MEKENKQNIKKEKPTSEEKTVKPARPLQDDPYDGTLSKTNFLLKILIFVSLGGILVGAIWTIFVLCTKSPITFGAIQTGVILASTGLLVLVASCLTKAVVDKKRNAAYHSVHEIKPIQPIHTPERITEKAKRGQSTSETTLTINDTKESSKFCPHCKQRIPQSSGLFCPKCGKRTDIPPLSNV